MAHHLRRQGRVVGRKRVRRLMAKMGLAALHQRPRTTVPNSEHKTWPYLLGHLVIDRPNQDRSRRHHLHLHAPGRPLPRRHHGLGEPASAGVEAVEHPGRGLSRIEALEDALARHGRPGIFNFDRTGQGSQFTTSRFSDILIDAGVKVSMDGRGRGMDNVFIERLWRSLTYECVCLHAFETGSETRAGIGRRITSYNTERPHSALGGRTPLKAQAGDEGLKLAA